MEPDWTLAVAQVIEYLREEGPTDSRAREICRQLAGRITRASAGDPARVLHEGRWTPHDVEAALRKLVAVDKVAGLLIRELAPTAGTGERPEGRGSVHVTVLGDGVAAGRDIVGGQYRWGSRTRDLAAEELASRTEPRPKPAIAPPARSPADDWAESTAPASPDPDLELRVLMSAGVTRPALSLELILRGAGSVGGGPHCYGPITLQIDPAAYVGELFESLDRPGRQPDREGEVRAAGADLCRQLVPPELADRLSRLRHRCHTMLLRSEEPWLPWELVVLPGSGAPFLSEAFDLTRWPLRRPPPIDLPLRRIAVVSAGGDQIGAVDEADRMLERRGRARTVTAVPARLRQVIDAMDRAEFDGWHFCGHGLAARGDANQAAIVLDDASRLTPRHLSGEAAGLALTHPLVFFNGCHTGRTGFTLTAAGGWSHGFVNAGAGAFLGAFWSVPGAPAAEFAQAFYDQFLGGVPLGAAVRAARQQLRSTRPGDVTRLAYTAYGHPLASVDGMRSWTGGSHDGSRSLSDGSIASRS